MEEPEPCGPPDSTVPVEVTIEPELSFMDTEAVSGSPITEEMLNQMLPSGAESPMTVGDDPHNPSLLHLLALINGVEERLTLAKRDQNLTSAFPHIQQCMSNVLRMMIDACKQINPSSDFTLEQNWPREQFEQIIVHQDFDDKSLSKVCQKFLRESFVVLQPSFYEALRVESVQIRLQGETDLLCKVEEIHHMDRQQSIFEAERFRHLQEIADHQLVNTKQEEEIASLGAELERRHQASLETDENSKHLVSENRKLVKQIEALSKVEPEPVKQPTINCIKSVCKNQCSPDCLCEAAYKQCEEAYQQLQTVRDELDDIKVENARLHEKNGALEFENEAQKIRRTELDQEMAIILNSQKHSEDRIQQLLAQVELLEEQNKDLQGSAWTTIEKQKKKTTFSQQAVLSAPPTSLMGPPATPAASRTGSTLSSSQTSSTATPRAAAASTPPNQPSYAAAVAAPASPHQGRQVRHQTPPLDITVGHFQTFYGSDFAHAISDQSKAEAREYVKLIIHTKNALYEDVCSTFHQQLANIDPASSNLLPSISPQQQADIFKTILKELCIARSPNDLKQRLHSIRGGFVSEPPQPQEFFLLPGLIPNRIDWKHIYNSTLMCANKSEVQMLMAIHVTHLWRNVAILDHFSDNTAKKTNALYLPRGSATEYTVALNLVCLFLAEELHAFMRFQHSQGPNQISGRPMVPDGELANRAQIDFIAKLKQTPICLRNLLDSDNPARLFYQAYREEKVKFRKMLGRTSSSKRRHDDSSLFD